MAIKIDPKLGCSRASQTIDGKNGVDYYRLLQEEIEVLRPFVWLQFYSDDISLGEPISLDHKDYDDTNRFRFIQKFEHKLYAAGGEAVQFVLYDEGGFKMPTILRAFLHQMSCGPQFAQGSQHYIKFQYGWHSENLYQRINNTDKMIWASEERLLVVTKVDIAFDEGGVTYTIGGMDFLACIQSETPIQQYPKHMLIHEAFREVCKKVYDIDFCVSEEYARHAGTKPSQDFMITDPDSQASNPLEWMNKWCTKLSKNGEYTLHVAFQSFAGNHRVELHLNKSMTPKTTREVENDGSADDMLLKGWNSDGLLVNSFEKAGRGGVVINFRPSVNQAALSSMIVNSVAPNPSERAVHHASSQPTTDAEPCIKTNYEKREGTQVNIAQNKLDEVQLTRTIVGAVPEKIEKWMRDGGDFHIVGIQADLECLGMPKYDDRMLIATESRYVKLDVRMPWALPGTVGSDWSQIAQRNPFFSGYWLIADISHRIDSSVGYSTAYTLSKQIPPGKGLNE